jgi:uncharacterized protein (TIGR03032 family)
MNSSPPLTEPVEITCSVASAFVQWLAGAGGSLAVSTYQAGKVAMIGFDGRQVTLLMRHFDKPLGLAAGGGRIALATRNDLWLFANAPPLAHDYLEEQPGRYDALFLPRATYHTGDLHTHDLALCDGELWLVNTRFSCLARLSYDYSFVPAWKPGFVTDLVPEDRCHLNGVAVRDGRPRYVTALGMTDTAGGWRENKARGGLLLDVDADEVLLSGLSMPHSPRWHDGRLWVLNSGTGELLVVDPDSGKPTTVCRLDGYLRGLCFVGPYAVIGMSKIRERHVFGGLPIQERCEGRLRCGLTVVDTRRGEPVGMFEFTSGCEEIYDVQFLPGLYRPTILNLDKPAAREAITHPECAFWLRPDREVREGAEVGGGGSVPDAAEGRVGRTSGPSNDGLEVRSTAVLGDGLEVRSTGSAELSDVLPSSGGDEAGPTAVLSHYLPESGNRS